MLNAKKARELAEQNKISNTLLNLEKAIKKAVEKGADHILTMSTITAEIENKLIESGYKVEQQISGTKISW